MIKPNEMARIPSIPLKKVKEAIAYADNPDNWLDMDLPYEDISKYTIVHRGLKVSYIVEYRNIDDRVGPLPERHLSITSKSKLDKAEYTSFIERTLKAFGFEYTPEQLKRVLKTTQAHFYSYMFKLDE